MSQIYAFLAEGFEEVECLAVVDLLRRAKLQVSLISITGEKAVTGSHHITVLADALFEETNLSNADLLFLPGGVPGTPNLAAHKGLTDALKNHAANGKRLAAICAAPSILGGLNILKNKKATCYPGWEDKLTDAIYQPKGVVTDGTITTAKGLGFAIDLGLELISLLLDKETSEKIKSGIQYNDEK